MNSISVDFKHCVSRIGNSLTQIRLKDSKQLGSQTNSDSITFYEFIDSKYLKNHFLKNFDLVSEKNLNSHFKKFAALLKFISFEFDDRISAIHPLSQIIEKRQLANSQLFFR